MTALEDGTTRPQAPDEQVPPHSEARRARQVHIGWHVRVAGRFLLVYRADPLPRERVSLCFADGATLACARGDLLWTRTPAEQLAYVSQVEAPNRAVRYTPPGQRGPLATPFSGSAPGRGAGGAP